VPAIQPSTPQRIAWAILIALTLYVCYFSHLDVIGFVGPDEPRYAWIARDMAESGDWITPRLYGKPWFEKPPLLYWGGAIFFKLLGEDHPETAARLPSAISALLATLALAWLAWRTYGEECARWLLLLLPTSIGMIGFSHAAATDMPFAGMLTIAVVCAAVVLGLVPPTQNTPVLPRTPWLALLLFGFFLGLAVLAKGPAGIILIGGSVFFWALFTKRWRDTLRLLHPAAIAAFCFTALPWYILCARRNPDFFRIFIIEHNFKRYLTPEFQHIQPFWFYIPILLIALLPWTLPLSAVAIWQGRRLTRMRQVQPISVLVITWTLFVILFFTISRSKLPGYVLPALPVVAMLGARVFSDAPLLPRRVSQSILVTLTIPIVLAIASCSPFVHQRYLDSRSARPIAHMLEKGVPKLDRLRVFEITRSEQYGLNFYLRQEIPSWLGHEIRDGYVLTDRKYCDSLHTEDTCEDLWGRSDFSASGASALLKITPRDSLGGSSAGRQPQ